MGLSERKRFNNQEETKGEKMSDEINEDVTEFFTQFFSELPGFYWTAKSDAERFLKNIATGGFKIVGSNEVEALRERVKELEESVKVWRECAYSMHSGLVRESVTP